MIKQFQTKAALIEAKAQDAAAKYEGAIIEAERQAAADSVVWVGQSHSAVLGLPSGWNIQGFGFAA